MDSFTLNISGIYKNFEDKLLLVNRKELLFNFLKNLISVLIYFFVVAVFLIASESFLRLSSKPRAIIYWGFNITFFSLLVYFLLKYILCLFGIINKFDTVSYAYKTGKYFSDIKDKLANALSIYKSDSKKYYSDDLSDSNLINIHNLFSKRDLSSFINFKRLKTYLFRFGLIVIVSSLIFAVFPGTMFSSLKRYINYNYEFFDNEYGIAFEIIPGNVTIIKGSKQDISINVKSLNPDFVIDKINLVYNLVSDNEDIIKQEILSLEPSGYNTFKTTIENINTEIIYYAEFRGVKSKEFKISLESYPVVKSFNVTVTPPAYTNSKTENLKENEGNIICPEGSKVEFSLTSSKELSSAGIMLNGKIINFAVDGLNSKGLVDATEEGKYYFVLKDLIGAENRSTQTYELKVIKDRIPNAVIVSPAETDYTLRGEKSLPVRIRITDDYGFSGLKINYRVINESSLNYSVSNIFNSGKSISAGTINIPLINRNATSVEVPYLWDIYSIKFGKGQIVEYWAEVTDVAGKTGVSDIKVLRYKSVTELFKESEKLTKEIEENLKSLYNDINNLQKDLADLQKQLQNSEELGVNDAANKKQLEQRIENIQNNINTIQQKIDQAIENLKQNNQLSNETLQQFMKLQEMFNKLATPEFLEKLRKIQEALKKDKPSEIKQDLQNINFDEEAYKKQLEQMMNLLQKIENLQKLVELSKKAEELLREQENLKLETMNSDKNNPTQMKELSDKQKKIQEDYEKWKQDLKNLSNNAKNNKEDFNTDKLDKAIKKTNERQTESKMKKSSEQLNANNKENSLDTQDEILQDLNDVNEDMMDATESAMDMEGAFEKVMKDLKDIKQKIDQLATDQGKLKSDTKQVNPQMKGDVQNLKNNQSGLQKRLSDLMNQLFQLSMFGLEIPQELGKELGNAYNSMKQAEENLEKSDVNEAEKNQNDAQQALNNASNMLDNMMKQMGKEGKKPGSGRMGMLMSKLAQLVKMQQGLNSEMNQLYNNGKPGKNGKEGQDKDEQYKDQIEKLKLKQEQIKKSIEELNSEIEKEYQKSGEKPVGDLKPVIEDMNKTIRELENNQLDPETIQRQNKIVNRMLEFQLSQREKDFEQKRESNPGENMIRMSPSEIVITGPASFNSIKEDFLRKQNFGFTEEYQKLIEMYLKSINK